MLRVPSVLSESSALRALPGPTQDWDPASGRRGSCPEAATASAHRSLRHRSGMQARASGRVCSHGAGGC